MREGCSYSLRASSWVSFIFSSCLFTKHLGPYHDLSSFWLEVIPCGWCRLMLHRAFRAADTHWACDWSSQSSKFFCSHFFSAQALSLPSSSMQTSLSTGSLSQPLGPRPETDSCCPLVPWQDWARHTGSKSTAAFYTSGSITTCLGWTMINILLSYMKSVKFPPLSTGV